jgi:hypothetical protein
MLEFLRFCLHLAADSGNIAVRRCLVLDTAAVDYIDERGIAGPALADTPLCSEFPFAELVAAELGSMILLEVPRCTYFDIEHFFEFPHLDLVATDLVFTFQQR